MNNFIATLSNIVSDDGKPDFKAENPIFKWFRENSSEFWIILIIGILLGIFITVTFYEISKEIHKSKKQKNFKKNNDSESE